MAKRQLMHPIAVNEERIEELGVMVFDDVYRMPVYREPYVSRYFTIGLNLEGWARLEYDTRPVTFKKHDVAIVYGGHMLLSHESSDDFHVIMVVLSQKFVEEMRSLTPSVFLSFHNYVWQPDFHLTDEQFDNVYRMMQLLRNVSLSDMKSRKMVLQGLLHILATMLQDYRKENGGTIIPISSRHELFSRFHKAVTEHYRESREVRYYANLFCLTPKHFASVIKQVTGINASDWISSQVMVQAKTLLLSNQQYTIQQVANHLGFPDQASFSRYFKTNEGVSPSVFRENAQ